MLKRVALGVTLVILAAAFWRYVDYAPPDTYPRDSSMRTDWAGTSLLREALERAQTSQVSQNVLPLNQAVFDQKTVIYFGQQPYDLATEQDSFYKQLESIATRGNTLVIGVSQPDFFFFEGDSPAAFKTKAESGKNRWGIRAHWKKKASQDGDGFVLDPGKSWTAEPRWKLFTRNFGKGRIILVDDAARLENANLIRDPNASALTARLLSGSPPNIVFEESHLGIAETGSIAGLARRYHLGGLILGLLIVTALCIWHFAVRFPPAPPDEVDLETCFTASDSRDVMKALLHRHIPRTDLVRTCIAEWNRTEPRRKIPETAIASTDPVTAFRELQQQFSTRSTKR